MDSLALCWAGDITTGSAARRALAFLMGTVHALGRWESMDKQTKREFWLLAIGTALIELPVAFAAFSILSH